MCLHRGCRLAGISNRRSRGILDILPQTSTQVMCAAGCSPSADSGRPATSLRRTKGPSCGGERAVPCGVFTASAIIEKHHTRHAGYGRDVNAMFLAVEVVPRYKLVNAANGVPRLPRATSQLRVHLRRTTTHGLDLPYRSLATGGGHNIFTIAYVQRRSQL
jgi:hypothetical protein